MLRRVLAPLALALLALSPLGCGPGGVLERFTPDVSFQNVAVRNIDLTQVDLDFAFAIDNPNPVQVVLETFSYTLDLQGHQLATGASDAGVRLEPRGDSTMILPVTLRYTDIIRIVPALIGRDRADYRIQTRFGFSTPLGVVNVPVSGAGQVPIPRPTLPSL